MSDPRHQEIIIIKRGNEEEEAHHGGAWKIAFADFMTAMMALFLVLWLINAANEETKRAVASYFNPIKLVDRNRSVKGVDEQKGGPTTDDETGGTPSPANEFSDESITTKSLSSKTAAEQARNGNEAFFADPMAALDQIEASVLEKQGISNNIETKGEGTPAGQFTDPFSPDFQEIKPTQKADNTSREAVAEKSEGKDKQAPEPTAAKPQMVPENKQAEEIKKQQLTAGAAELASTIRQEIGEKLGADAATYHSIKVKAVENGILIQITDMPAVPMFEIGAAVPSGETVIAVNAVAKALGGRAGPVHVYGHTDARKFDGPGNGNWRLSLDRAQSVYFILLRAGLAENRFAEVSGFADRKPIIAGDPFADQNRRIEIFLEQQ